MPVSVAIGQMVGPRWWLPFIMAAWGTVTTVQAVMSSRAQMLALRLLLGVFEAGYFPTAYYIGNPLPDLPSWFPAWIGLCQLHICWHFFGIDCLRMLYSSLLNWERLASTFPCPGQCQHLYCILGTGRFTDQVEHSLVLE